MIKPIVIITIILIAVAATFVLLDFSPPSERAESPGTQISNEAFQQQLQRASLSSTIADLQETETIELLAVDGSDAFGTAHRLILEGTTRHTAKLRLPIPPSGTVYEGWLVRPNPFDLISTGIVERDRDGTDEPSHLRKWNLNFASDTDYTNYTTVVITLETSIDETPEEHILEGSF